MEAEKCLVNSGKSKLKYRIGCLAILLILKIKRLIMKKSVFKLLSLDSSLIWSAMVCGATFILIVIGAIPIDYSKELPDWFFNLLSKSDSYYNFCLLSLAYCLLVGCLTRFGTNSILESSLRYKGLTLIGSKIIGIGLVLSATLIGMGLGLYFLSQIQPDTDLFDVAVQILNVGVFFVLYNLTLIFFFVLFLKQNASDCPSIYVLGLLFSCVSILLMSKLQFEVELFTATGNFVIFVLGGIALDLGHRFGKGGQQQKQNLRPYLV